MRTATAITATLAVVALVGCDPQTPAASTKSDIKEATSVPRSVKDIDGNLVADVKPGSCRVIFFLTTDCPIANRYAPEMRRIADDFADRPVQFLFVYPNEDDTLEDISKHREEYSLGGTAVRDVDHTLVTIAGATVTPEAAVFNDTAVLQYCGRIDDWYVDFGKNRKEPTVHDLRDAIEAVLTNEPIPNLRVKAIGCYIPKKTGK